MKILNINKYYFIKGGAERFYFELAKLLEEHGHEMIPFAMQHENNFQNIQYEKYFVSEIQTEEVKLGWQGLRTATRFFWSFEAQRKLNKLIKVVETRHALSLQSNKINLAVLHNIYHQISPSILSVLKKHKIPVILIVHDYGLLSPNYTMFANGKIYDKICGHGFLKCLKDKSVRNSWLASAICGLETWFHHSVLDIYKKNIDVVICPSQFMRQMFLKGGWPEEKLVYLPHFMKTLKHESISAAGGSAFGGKTLKQKETYILYLGRLSEEKGVDSLIEAVRNLPEVKLKIVGGGPEKKNYELRIMNYGLKNIETVGHKSSDELQEFIAKAKFIVVPSIWYENYPMSVLESYALGRPALVANIGGLPEMVPNRDKNFLFEPGNIKELTEKIKFLWANEDILIKAGERAKSFVKENNDPKKYYEEFMKICSNLLK